MVVALSTVLGSVIAARGATPPFGLVLMSVFALAIALMITRARCRPSKSPERTRTREEPRKTLPRAGQTPSEGRFAGRRVEEESRLPLVVATIGLVVMLVTALGAAILIAG